VDLNRPGSDGGYDSNASISYEDDYDVDDSDISLGFESM